MDIATTITGPVRRTSSLLAPTLLVFATTGCGDDVVHPDPTSHAAHVGHPT